MSHPTEMLELAAIHALGALDEGERVRFERHLADGCPQCRAALRESSGIVDLLALSVAPIPPSPGARRRLLASLDSARPSVRRPPARRPRRAWVPWAAAASIAIVAGLAAYGNPSALLRVREVVQGATAPGLKTVALDGAGALVSARARAYVDPERNRLVLYAYDLPPTPEARDYQLWVIGEGAPVSAGILAPDASGSVRHEVTPSMPLDGPLTVAVSVEPEGGVPQPTGPIVLSGS